MYRDLVAFLAVLSVCAARPAPDTAGSLESISPSIGFPIDFVPSPAVLQNASGNLELPINPHLERAITVVSGWTGTSTFLPKRADLAMSLAIEIYWYWRLDDNSPITRTFIGPGFAPFDQFWYRITPIMRTGSFLTPRKLGVASCWMLAYVVSHDITSTQIQARINENAHGSIGTVDIIDVPGAASMAQSSIMALERTFRANETFNSVLQPGDQNSALRITPDEMERRWFGCIYKMLLFIVEHPISDLVAITLPLEPLDPSSSPPSKTYRFRCVPHDPRIRDYVDVTLYVAAVTRFVTWKLLADELLLLGSGVALGQPYSTAAFVRDGIAILAQLKVTVDGGEVDGDVTDVTDTATA
ncbi:MAG: hypothetical protein Q9209_006534 [Squamulea sp. 1 TL-2023]